MPEPLDLTDQFSAFDHFKKKLFDEADRLPESASFRFTCRPGISCFNLCCSDVNVFLTPYDVIRLKNRLGIHSEDFLAKYTIMPIDERLAYPIILFRMSDDDSRSCPFVDPVKGCSVYEDRPWPCRMFPIGKASPKAGDAMPFYFFLREDVCRGFEEADQEWTISGWIDDQKAREYDAIGEEFKKIVLHNFFGRGERLTPPLMEMFHMVCYNIDKFRSFVFESSFLKRFDIPEARLNLIKTDDVELLRFGFDWLRFAIFREKSIAVRDEALKAARGQV